jgi:hypothetical protein
VARRFEIHFSACGPFSFFGQKGENNMGILDFGQVANKRGRKKGHKKHGGKK